MAASTDRLSGTFWLLFLYDVCEEIRLEELRGILGAQPAGREPSFRRPTPEYVRFEKPPVIEALEPLRLETGERLQAQMHYYEYGVVSIELQLPFEFDWRELMRLSSRSIAAPEIEKQAADSVRRSLARAQPGAGEAVHRLADGRLLHHPAPAHDAERWQRGDRRRN